MWGDRNGLTFNGIIVASTVTQSQRSLPVVKLTSLLTSLRLIDPTTVIRHQTAEIPADNSVRAARLRAIKADIVTSLDRGDMSVETLAARHGVTPRYVQILFNREATTCTEFVRSQRLALAHRMLIDPHLAHRSITSVAFDVGFNDLSYFNRLFRRRFGCPPSQLRRAARGPEMQGSRF